MTQITYTVIYFEPNTVQSINGDEKSLVNSLDEFVIFHGNKDVYIPKSQIKAIVVNETPMPTFEEEPSMEDDYVFTNDVGEDVVGDDNLVDEEQTMQEEEDNA